MCWKSPQKVGSRLFTWQLPCRKTQLRNQHQAGVDGVARFVICFGDLERKELHSPSFALPAFFFALFIEFCHILAPLLLAAQQLLLGDGFLLELSVALPSGNVQLPPVNGGFDGTARLRVVGTVGKTALPQKNAPHRQRHLPAPGRLPTSPAPAYRGYQ